MSKRLARLASAFVLALATAAFAGSALAGNGNGNGSGNSDANANPTAAATQPASQDTGSSAKTPPGQAKKDQSSTQAQGSAGQNSASVKGIKPTNATSKGTHCATGGGTGSSATCTPTNANAAVAAGHGAGDASKRYGNGTTAAQIANSRGAPANTDVYGPGNSQPHKVACPGSDKYRDVHAVKNYTQTCAVTSQPTSKGKNEKTTTPTGNVIPTVTTAGVPAKAASPSVAAGVQATPAAGAAPTGGVLGVTTSAGKGAPEGGVLGAIEAVGEGALPFTGFPLWAALLIGLGLLTLGLALRRHARVTA